MQYNIFKLENKEELQKEMLERNFKKIGNEISSDKYKLNLYYKYDNDLKLSWKNILIEFGETNPPARTGISGIIVCESCDNNYAITYGSSSFLVQKYSDREFGFNFAKRIELKEMKRKSSMTPHSRRNSSITSFKNMKTIVFDSGENITSLSFTPENEFYGKRIDIGKSIKLKVNISLSNIYQLFNQIESDISNNIINKIPLLTKITNADEIERYNKMMYDSLSKEFDAYGNSNLSQFSMNEFYIVGSSIYFEEDHTQVVKVGKYEEEIELHNLKDLFELSKTIGVDIQTIIEKGKIVYKDSSNTKIYAESIRKYINYEIEEENVSLYNDEWFYYNNDYYDLVMNEIKTIRIEYNSSDDYTKEQIENFRSDDKEYREEILNKVLSKKYNGILLDRDMFISKYENEYFNSEYKIELADLLLKNEYVSVKIGSAQALSYCVDQSELSAKLIDANKINLDKKGLPIPDKFGVWFFMESNSVFEGGKVNLQKIHSIMLLSKLSTWSKNIKTLGKIPIIHINKYIK